MTFEQKIGTEELIIAPQARNMSPTLANSKHLSAARWACSLGCCPTVLHGYTFRVFNLLLGTALNAICLHVLTSSFRFIMTIEHSSSQCQ